ncbi:MAG: hypothetical protein KAV82_10460 [Phycisphaerae bacterium]|nr:hypothetical protein [Phycisphaerae bacterium]
MTRRNLWVNLFWVGMVGPISGVLIGCNQGGGSSIPALPAELVVWGDPTPDSDAMFTSVRDFSNVDTSFVVIGTNNLVQFFNEKVCNVCEVQESTILINGTPRVDIRFGPGPDGTGERRPFLVSVDGYYIELVQESGAISFQEKDVVFEENDDPSDDLAQRVGTMPNPTAAS